MYDPYTIELKNKEFELRILKEAINEYFDLPVGSMAHTNFYRYYKAKLRGRVQ